MSGEGAKVDHPAQVSDILGRWAQAAQRGEPIEKVLSPAEIAMLKEAAPKIAAAVQQRGSAIFQDPAAFQSRVRQALSNPDGAPSPADANPGGGPSTTAAEESATGGPTRPPSTHPPAPPTVPPTANEKPSLIPGLESETLPPTPPTIPGLPQSEGWGEVGPQHIGQQVETRDGLTGTLRDVGQRNVAFKDATGKAYAVPIADTRLAEASNTAPGPRSARQTPETSLIPGLPQSEGWGGVGPQHIGQPVETRDGLTGTLWDVGQRKVAFKDATGKAYAIPIGEARLAKGNGSAQGPQSPPSINGITQVGGDTVPPPVTTWRPANRTGDNPARLSADRTISSSKDATPPDEPAENGETVPRLSQRYADQGLLALIRAERAEIEAEYGKLGLQTTDDPGRKFAVHSDPSGRITPNLPEDRLLEIALWKSQGNPEAAESVIKNTQREEFYHAVDDVGLLHEWLARGGESSGEDFVQFKGRRNTETVQDVVHNVESLPPDQRGKAIHDAVTILRNYREKYKGDSDLKLWQELQADTPLRKMFANEVVRQLAQFAMDNDNSETGYLQHLDPQEFAKRHEFYGRMVRQAQGDIFGPLLRRAIDRTIAGVRNPESLRIAR